MITEVGANTYFSSGGRYHRDLCQRRIDSQLGKQGHLGRSKEFYLARFGRRIGSRRRRRWWWDGRGIVGNERHATTLRIGMG